MKKALLLLVPLVFLFMLQCSNNPVNEGKGISPQDSAAADNLAARWFQAIADTLATLDGKGEAGVKATDLSAIRAGFNSALSHNPNNSVAHLGLSILEILELNYSADVWAVVDSLQTWGRGLGSPSPAPAGVRRGNPIIGHQFTLLAGMPLNCAMRTIKHFPPNVTISHIQDIIEHTIMPALTRSINHLATVEQNTKAHVTVTLRAGDGEETIIIDLGEIYFFDASVHALRGGFGFAIAYDYDLVGPDGTYSWIDDISRISQTDCARYALTAGPSGDTLDVVDHCSSPAEVDSIAIAVGHYNLAHRPSFLTLRKSGTVLSAAGLDLSAVIDKLKASVNFIKYVRPSETAQNVIKLSNLTDLESGLGNPNGPNFAKDFHSIEDVLDWARDFAGGQMQFSEELGPSHETFTWTTNMHAFITNPVQDWKSLLPYYRWALLSGPWISRETVLEWEYAPYYHDWDAYVYESGVCQDMQFTNIAWVREYCLNTSMSTAVIELLDGPNGDVIDLNVAVMPYFPDYTFHGVLPDMNRARWIQLINILQ